MSLPDLTGMLQQGASNVWLFVPSAILLGALHGLEPGHSKTMMAAFIVAIRGTVGQAVLLGLAATLSHTAVVWAVALAGLHCGSKVNAERLEPYFQLASGVIVIGVALWMLARARKLQNGAEPGHEHHHHHHAGEAETGIIETEAGRMALQIHEDGVPPRFRLRSVEGAQVAMAASGIVLETERVDGRRQRFSFRAGTEGLESVETIPEPHAFVARLWVKPDALPSEMVFTEEQPHHGGHAHGVEGMQVAEDADAHEREHAEDIRRRFGGRGVTTGQLVLFGLTGGLVPCPAAITVLLVCLQLKQMTLGATVVVCFSIGLALTLVLSGTLAALSLRRASRRWSGFGRFARLAPYLSGALMTLVGLYMGWHGWHGLGR